MKYVLMLALMSGVGVWAAAPAANGSASKSKMDRLAAEFYLNQARGIADLMQGTNGRSRDCDHDGGQPACVDVVCSRLGQFGCDDMSEVERVGRICRGNINGGCVDAVCDKLGQFGCDDFSEVERVTTMCRGHYNGRCIDVACDHLGHFGCDDISEVTRVGQACRAVDGDCMESVCQKLGTFGCDDISEIERVAASCRGN
jgi:hypothetical protein